MKSWWPEVDRIEIATFKDFPAAAAEERAQIAALKPVHNRLPGNCSHDLSLPGAVYPSNGTCRICDRERQRAASRTPEGQSKQRARDRVRQPLHNAARRRRRRSPGAGQGNLW